MTVETASIAPKGTVPHRTIRGSAAASIAQPAKSVSSPKTSPAQAFRPRPFRPHHGSIARRTRTDFAIDCRNGWPDRSYLVLECWDCRFGTWEAGLRGTSAQKERNHSCPGRDPTSRSPHRRATWPHLRRAAVAPALVDSPVVIAAQARILPPTSLVTEIPDRSARIALGPRARSCPAARLPRQPDPIRDRDAALLSSRRLVDFSAQGASEPARTVVTTWALAVASDRPVYVRALASVAGKCASRSQLAASGGRLIRRLQRILGSSIQWPHPSRWLIKAWRFSAVRGGDRILRSVPIP